MQQTTTPFLNSCNQWNYLTPVISELKCSHHRQFGIEKLIATTVFKLILKWKLCNSNYRWFGCNYPSIPFLWSPGEHSYYPISITVTGVIQAAGNRWTLIHPIAVSYDHPIPLLPWRSLARPKLMNLQSIFRGGGGLVVVSIVTKNLHYRFSYILRPAFGHE